MPALAKPILTYPVNGSSNFRRYNSAIDAGPAMWMFNSPSRDPSSNAGDFYVRDAMQTHGNLKNSPSGAYGSLDLYSSGVSPFAWKTGVRGRVLDRANTASTDRMLIGNSNYITTSTFSILAGVLVRSTSSSGYGTVLTMGNTAGLWIHSSAGSAPFKLDFFQGSDHLSTGTLSSGVEHDIAVIGTGGTITYWIDGILDASSYSGITSVTLSNAFSDSSSEFLDGQMSYLYFLPGIAASPAFIQRTHSDPFWMFRRNVYPWFKAGAGPAFLQSRPLIVSDAVRHASTW